MRKPAIVLMSLVALGFSSAAFAATSNVATGTIKSLDSKAMTLTLSNGQIYHLPRNFKLASLKAGEKVKVTWSMKGKDYDATAIAVQ